MAVPSKSLKRTVHNTNNTSHSTTSTTTNTLPPIPTARASIRRSLLSYRSEKNNTTTTTNTTTTSSSSSWVRSLRRHWHVFAGLGILLALSWQRWNELMQAGSSLATRTSALVSPATLALLAASAGAGAADTSTITTTTTSLSNEPPPNNEEEPSSSVSIPNVPYAEDRQLFAVDTSSCRSPEADVAFPLGAGPRGGEECPWWSSSEDESTTTDKNIWVVGDGQAHGRSLVCGLCTATTHHPTVVGSYLAFLQRKLRRLRQDKCPRLVIYSVAFGDAYKDWYTSARPMDPVLADTFVQTHGLCSLVFVLGNFTDSHVGAITNSSKSFPFHFTRSLDQTNTLIHVPPEVLPYRSMRRNTKLFKLVPHLLFPWTRRVLYVAAKVTTDRNWYARRMESSGPSHKDNGTATTGGTSSRPTSIPLPHVNYHKYIASTLDRYRTCAAFMTLPLHKSTMGQHYVQAPSSPPPVTRLAVHCRHLVQRAQTRRRTLTDNVTTLEHQCRGYLATFGDSLDDGVNNTENNSAPAQHQSSEILDSKLIDGFLVAWDLEKPHCQKFVADLTCTWLSEIHCHSDRDQVSFPYAATQMQLLQQVSPDIGNNETIYSYSLRRSQDTHRVFRYATSNHPLALFVAGNCHPIFPYSWHFCDFTGTKGSLSKFDPQNHALTEFDTGGRPENVVCLSPEGSVNFPLGGCAKNSKATLVGRSQSSQRTCGFCSQSRSIEYLEYLGRKIRKLRESLCPHLVIFSVGFGEEYAKWFTETRVKRRIALRFLYHHNRCSITFLLGKDLPEGEAPKFRLGKSRDGIETLIYVHPNLLPYSNHRRNTKLLKMTPHLLFPWARRVVYYAAKLRWDYQWFSPVVPVNYHRYLSQTMTAQNTCSTFMSMPVHPNTIGLETELKREGIPRLSYHCDYVMNATLRRPTVTDDLQALRNQCITYLREYASSSDDRAGLEQRLMETNQRLPPLKKNSTKVERFVKEANLHPTKAQNLDNKLIEGAVVAWDLTTPRCRQYTADFLCTWLDEVHCHGDRDQMSFPYAAAQMNLNYQLLGNASAQQYHRVFGDGPENPLAFFTAGNCHLFYWNAWHLCDYTTTGPVKKNTIEPKW